MKFKHEIKEGNILVIHLSGDLIGEDNGASILELASDNINNKVRYCIVDISQVRYINSSGIGVLITILTKFRNKGGEVYLINPSENVKKLLIITKLNAIFNVAESEEDAVKRMMTMLTELKDCLNKINENTVKHFVHDQLITDSYLGHKVIEAVLMKVSVHKNSSYEVAHEKDGFDGYIGSVPVLIEPFKNHQDPCLDEDIMKRIFYKKDGEILHIYVDF